MAFCIYHVVYLLDLIKEVISNVNINWKSILEQFSRADICTKVMVDEVLNLSFSLVKVVLIIDQGPLVRVGIHGQLSDRALVTDQLKGAEVETEGNQHSRQEKIEQEALSVSHDN